MKPGLAFCIFLIAVSNAFAQFTDSLNTKPQPRGGKAALQIVYYRIDFSKEETDYLRSHAPELIFSVTDKGVAKLEKVNDIEMRSIIDSMMFVNDRLPEFYPQRENGRAEAGIYFLKLAWPNYQSQPGTNLLYPFNQMNSTNLSGTPNQYPYQYLTYYNPYMRKLSDFSEITYRRPRYDMLIGGYMAGFGGNLSKYLDNGWGTRFDFMIYGNKGWGGGFGTTLTIAKSFRSDPGVPVRLQGRSHLITLFSGSFGKMFRETRIGQFSLQLDPAFGITDIIDSSYSGAAAIGLGFSPGASLHYLLPLGKGRMGRQYFLPIAYKQYFSFHLGVRSLMFNLAQATGTITEFGVAYRLSQRPVANYKLKDPGNGN